MSSQTPLTFGNSSNSSSSNTAPISFTDVYLPQLLYACQGLCKNDELLMTSELGAFYDFKNFFEYLNFAGKILDPKVLRCLTRKVSSANSAGQTARGLPVPRALIWSW